MAQKESEMNRRIAEAERSKAEAERRASERMKEMYEQKARERGRAEDSNCFGFLS